MGRQEAMEQYIKSLRLGQKNYKERVVRGKYPYPTVLDEILDENMVAGRADMGVLAIDMETAGLYINAAEAGKRALTICAVTDSLVTGEALPPAERQSSLTQMMEIALETAVRMAKR